MYVGVDVGGTKTLVAALDDHGVIKESVKFETPHVYANWLLELRHVAAHLKHQDFKAGAVAAPGRIDRKHGRLLQQPNLPWKNIPLQADAEHVFKCPIIIENDANLAGLSESMLLPANKRVMYITVSTGIGTAIMDDRRLAPAMLDYEGGQVLVSEDGTYTTWEKASAGRVLYAHFGKKIADIAADDTEAWNYIVRHLVVGLQSNLAVAQPDIVVFGGSVGTHFKHYGALLTKELEKFKNPVVTMPELVQAKRPEEAVVYGCYDLAKQTFA